MAAAAAASRMMMMLMMMLMMMTMTTAMMAVVYINIMISLQFEFIVGGSVPARVSPTSAPARLPLPPSGVAL